MEKVDNLSFSLITFLLGTSIIFVFVAEEHANRTCLPLDQQFDVEQTGESFTSLYC